ncbi:MAG TPA: RNA methyltransferase [Acidimicrobiales bacterium]|nr:RNA methyltransferase [Acidimicrobiales bacterium]
MIEGPMLLAEAVSAGVPIEAVFVEDGTPEVDAGGAPVHLVARGVIGRVASTVTPQPVLAVARRCDVPLATVADDVTFAVVLAGLADPGNVGTILRSAEAAGADAVVLTEGSVDAFNPKVVRASAGALFHVRVVVDVAVADVAAIGVPRLGAVAMGGVPYDAAPLDRPGALVLGSEAHGLPAGLALDGLVSIPHAGRVESLNVAMAATVLCFEVARRRRQSGTEAGEEGQ